MATNRELATHVVLTGYALYEDETGGGIPSTPAMDAWLIGGTEKYLDIVPVNCESSLPKEYTGWFGDLSDSRRDQERCAIRDLIITEAAL